MAVKSFQFNKTITGRKKKKGHLPRGRINNIVTSISHVLVCSIKLLLYFPTRRALGVTFGPRGTPVSTTPRPSQH